MFEFGENIINKLLDVLGVIIDYFGTFFEFCTTQIFGTIVRFNNPVIVSALLVALCLALFKIKERIL